MAWYNSSWGQRLKVTVPSSQVTSDLTDFPVYVDLSDAPAGFWSAVKSDGGDIVTTLSDGTTETAREVVSIDTGAETGELHFKATGTLSSSSDNDFYLYFDNPGASQPAASGTYGRDNVWTGYSFVSHDGGATDSSGNVTPTLSGGITAGTLTGKMGVATDFDGSNDSIDTNYTLPTGAFTNSCWYKPDSLTVDKWIFAQYLGGDSGRYIFGPAFSTFNNARYNLGSAAINVPNMSSTSVWQHVVVTKDGSNTELFYNSVSQATASGAGDTYQGLSLEIGYGQSLGGRYDGGIDEVRCAESVLSDDWIATEYANQNAPGTFVTWGGVETLVTGTADERHGQRGVVVGTVTGGSGPTGTADERHGQRDAVSGGVIIAGAVGSRHGQRDAVSAELLAVIAATATERHGQRDVIASGVNPVANVSISFNAWSMALNFEGE